MNQSLLAWLSLIGASCCQTGWTYSLKLIQVIDLPLFRRASLGKESLVMFGPWIGYIVFGALDSILLATAMRTIPTSTAFISWMGLSILMVKVCDTLCFKVSWSLSDLFFISLILIGILGLKNFT